MEIIISCMPPYNTKETIKDLFNLVFISMDTSVWNFSIFDYSGAEIVYIFLHPHYAT